MSFNDLRGGDRVAFWRHNGCKLVDGKAVPDWIHWVGKVCPLLVFHDHVVVNLGGRYGQPAVVDASNYIGRA